VTLDVGRPHTASKTLDHSAGFFTCFLETLEIDQRLTNVEAALRRLGAVRVLAVRSRAIASENDGAESPSWRSMFMTAGSSRPVALSDEVAATETDGLRGVRKIGRFAVSNTSAGATRGAMDP
jgi:hypothetical protein